MFQLLSSKSPLCVAIYVDGVMHRVPAHFSVAAALLALGIDACRMTPVGNMRRGPFCMMGICFDCLVQIDGVPNQQACMVRVRDGMAICTDMHAGGLR